MLQSRAAKQTMTEDTRLRGDALVVAADQGVGVVDGRAVHGEPADGAQAPAPCTQTA